MLFYSFYVHFVRYMHAFMSPGLKDRMPALKKHSILIKVKKWKTGPTFYLSVRTYTSVLSVTASCAGSFKP